MANSPIVTAVKSTTANVANPNPTAQSPSPSPSPGPFAKTPTTHQRALARKFLRAEHCKHPPLHKILKRQSRSSTTPGPSPIPFCQIHVTHKPAKPVAVADGTGTKATLANCKPCAVYVCRNPGVHYVQTPPNGARRASSSTARCSTRNTPR